MAAASGSAQAQGFGFSGGERSAEALTYGGGGGDFGRTAYSGALEFGIADHTVAGAGGEALYQGAKYFRFAGRALLVVGAAIDIYSIVIASKPLRKATQVVAGWAGAWAGCKAVGAGGAALVRVACCAGAGCLPVRVAL